MSTEEGGPVGRLTDEPLGAWDPDWSPDGERIAYVTDGQVRLVPCDGSGPATTLVDDVGEVASPSWSPSGDAIVFAVRDGGDWDLFVTDLDGQVTQLTDTPEVDEAHPSWGPALAG
ncbi:MAG TPA: LpqB family beta-propeller domain-containing protein [Actinomycetota bacterium]|nr:LpqB family beta-propeller domain-containing protein [Actinomycetota bacterium]